MTDRSLKTICSYLRKVIHLRELTISNEPAVTDAGVRKLAARLPELRRLRVLTFSGTSSRSRAGLLQLLTAMCASLLQAPRR